MDDTSHANHASEPSKSSASAKLEIKESSTDEKGGASIESKAVTEEKPEEVRRERRTSSYLARRRFVAEEPLNFRRSGYAQQARSTGRSYASQRGRDPKASEVETAGYQVAATDVPTLCTDRRRIRSVFKSQDSSDTKDGQVTIDGRVQETH